MHPCQLTMLTTRADFPGGERGYTCEAGKVACVVSGPGWDEETMEMVCGQCCEMREAPSPSPE